MDNMENTAPGAIADVPQPPTLSENARKLQKVFNEAFNDPDFFNDDKRIEKILKAFETRDNSDRVINQIRTQVEKELYTKHAKNGKPHPTEAEILTETKDRYLKHLERKNKKVGDRSFIEQIKAN